MVTGQWGSGKTHFIDTFLESFVPKPNGQEQHKPLRVSLYGVAGSDEIGDQLFQQLHPFLAHKATRLLGAVLRRAAKATIKVDVGHAAQLSGALPDADLTSLLGGAKGRIVVFDDFERAAMSPVALLGYINPLVERDECKVIILADEGKIADKDYKDRKEKTVGRTFKLRADVDAAFEAFMSVIDDVGARSFLTEEKGAILQVFADSGLDNLRSLRQFLWDFERFWKILTEEQRQHKEALHELVLLLCACAIELRSGRLTPEMFRRKDMSHHLRLLLDKPDEDAKAAQEIYSRYPTVRFDSTLLEPEMIIEIILRSKLPMIRIQDRLRLHPYFAKPENMPSWRALWHSSDAPMQEHDNIIHRFERDFDARTFRAEGEIDHIIGLSLLLSELGFPGWDSNDVEGKVKRYIDAVYAGDAASPDEVYASTTDRVRGGAFGLSYAHASDPRFAELARYHREQRVAWLRRAYPTIAEQLHRLMTEDSEAFLREVCFTNAGPSRCARLGVLKEIPAGQFAATLAAARFRDQEEVLMALSVRYRQVTAEPELEAEVPWLKEVQQQLRVCRQALPRLAGYHLSRMMREYIDKTVVDVDKWLQARRSSVAQPSTDEGRNTD